MESTPEPKGIGGWLVLPMIGLFITPLRFGLLFHTTFVPIFTQGTWKILTNPGSEAYHPLWAPVLIYEMVGNLIIIPISIILLILFFKRNYAFPKYMIIFMTANLVFVGLDFFASNMIPAVAAQEAEQPIPEVAKALIVALIWIPYFLKSKRVKNTFINGRKKN